MSDYFAILGMDTLSSPASLATAEAHNRRLKPAPNADPTRRSLNVDLVPREFQHLSFNERFPAGSRRLG